MASISREPNGRKTIQFVGADGKRRSIRLGKIDMRMAQELKNKFEKLVAASISGLALDNETAEWVSGLDSALHERLRAVGLVAKRIALESESLGAFLNAYIARRTDVKLPTKITYQHQRDASGHAASIDCLRIRRLITGSPLGQMNGQRQSRGVRLQLGPCRG